VKSDELKSEKLWDLAKKVATTFALMIVVLGMIVFISFEESHPGKTSLLVLCVPLSIGAFVFYTVRFLWVLKTDGRQK